MHYKLYKNIQFIVVFTEVSDVSSCTGTSCFLSPYIVVIFTQLRHYKLPVVHFGVLYIHLSKTIKEQIYTVRVTSNVLYKVMYGDQHPTHADSSSFVLFFVFRL